MDDLYKYIDTWNNERVFWYIVVFIIILWLFTGTDIGINILIAIIVGAFIVSYLNHQHITNEYTHDKIENIKKETIVPNLSEKSKQHNNIVDLLFSIQDMYAYAPQQYEEMIKNINYFYEFYKLSFIDEKTVYINYELMQQFKRDALNSLSSMIYSLPDDKRISNKLDAAAVVLDDNMTKHLDQISYLVDKCTFDNGYFVDTKVIDYGPKASNEYNDIFARYSYEIF
jgi:hypothetical protein